MRGAKESSLIQEIAAGILIVGFIFAVDYALDRIWDEIPDFAFYAFLFVLVVVWVRRIWRKFRDW